VAIFSEVLGREVNVPDEPKRIVSLSPAITETLFMLGLGDRVIGVSAFCARPEEAKLRRKVGSYSTTNIDLLREMNPDLILVVTGYQRELALRLSSEFAVYPISLPVSVFGIIDSVVQVGLVVGEQEKAWRLSSDLLYKTRAVKPIDTELRIYVEIDLGGPVSFGAHSYITDGFHLLGASTLFDHARSEWLTPDLEVVKSGNPDAIFYEAKMYSKFSEEALDRLIDKRGWRQLQAAKNNSYFLTPGPLDFLAHHGPSFVTDALPWLTEKLSRTESVSLTHRS
jgi:ABC-type Fe3+-hydroxamate transport system substrate-binding protein